MKKQAARNDLDFPVRLFRDPKAWQSWLVKNGGTAPGLWLRIGKKAGKIRSVTFQEALDVALCYGWIDGLRKSYDEDSFVQRFTPRGPRSMWSKINRARALELIEAGRMSGAGAAAIERAKQNGRWEAAYNSYSTSEVPADFVKALARSAKAKAFFGTLNRQNRFAMLFRIQTARKEETRKKRIEQFIAMLEKGLMLYPPGR